VNTSSVAFSDLQGRPIGLLKELQVLTTAGDVREWDVSVMHEKSKIQGRLCAIRKTEEAIALAQKKLRRKSSKSGKALQPTTLEFAKYVILFTTFPKKFTAADVLQWYRLRWQVELVFKRFKSIAQLGHLPKHDEESSKAWLYGKLFIALLIEKLIAHADDVSPWGQFVAK
jgi:IS4 transposase